MRKAAARKKKGRNPDGMGTLDYLPSGKVRLIRWENKKKRTGTAVESKGNKVADRKAALEAFNEKFAPKVETPKVLTVSKFLKTRIDALEDDLAPRTHDLYQRVYDNYILGQPIAKLPLAAVTAEHIDEWKEHLKTKLSDTSTQRYMQFVAAQFRYAKRRKMIAENPFDSVDLPSREKVTKTVLSKGKLNAFLKLPWNPRMRIAVKLMSHGLRKSEACGLKHEDFDGEGITVQRQAIEVAGELQILPLKTAGSYRWVPVDDELKKILAAKPEGWVLEGAKGKPLRGRTLHKWWHDTVKGTEFADVTPHDLRSTFAMLLLEANADVRTAAEILGHSPAVLARIYARSRKEVKMAALAKINALPTKQPTKQPTKSKKSA